MTAAATDILPSPPSIPGLTAWFQAQNAGAQPLYANAGKLQAPVYWQYIGTPSAHTPALDEEIVTLKAYMVADETYAMNSNSGQTTFGNDGTGPAMGSIPLGSTSVSAPLTVATPAIQAGIVKAVQVAVTLPSDHSVHTWFGNFLEVVRDIFVPIAQQVVVSEATALTNRISGAAPEKAS